MYLKLILIQNALMISNQHLPSIDYIMEGFLYYWLALPQVIITDMQSALL